MATSGVIDTTDTVRDVIKAAFELIGVDDNTEDAESYLMAMNHLRRMLKTWQNDGVNMWRIEDISVVWPAGEQSQVFGTDIITPTNVVDIQDARVVISGSFERTLGRFEYGDYKVLPNKAASGSPTIYSFQTLTEGARVYMWMVPTVSTTIKMTIARVIEDVTDLSETLDVPQRYIECVIYNLAARMLMPFSVQVSQPSVANDVKQMAAYLYAQMDGADRPSSLFIKPFPAA